MDLSPHAEFLAANLDSLGLPFVIEKLYEKDRDEHAQAVAAMNEAQAKFERVKALTRLDLDSLQVAWQAAQSETPKPTPTEFVARYIQQSHEANL